MDRRARLDQQPVSGARLASFGCRKTYPIATRPSSVSPTTGEGWKLTHLQRRRGRHRRDAALHCVLHLLEGADLDLAHALARDAEFLGQLHERDPFLGEPARLEDAPLALVEHGERTGQRLAAVLELLARGKRRLLVRGFVHQPVLPLAGIAVLADRGVERGVAAEPPIRRAMIFTWSGRIS